MQRDPTPVVLEVADGGRVVAIVESGEPADDVLRRAIEEAAARAGDLVVIQLTDEPSVVRRALAKAILARDVSWWSRDLIGIAASIEVMDDGLVDDAVALVRGAACIVLSLDTSCSARAMTVLRQHSPDLAPV
jgi:hypothetical protein